MVGTTISTKAADSRMFDFYDKLIGLGLGIGIYSGEQLKANRAITLCDCPIRSGSSSRIFTGWWSVTK